MILFDVDLEAHPGEAEALAALLRRTMQACTAERGCLRYRFTRDLDVEAGFHLNELWEDEAALRDHAAGEGFRAFLKELPKVGKVARSRAHQGDLAPYTFVRPAV